MHTTHATSEDLGLKKPFRPARHDRSRPRAADVLHPRLPVSRGLPHKGFEGTIGGVDRPSKAAFSGVDRSTYRTHAVVFTITSIMHLLVESIMTGVFRREEDWET